MRDAPYIKLTHGPGGIQMSGQAAWRRAPSGLPEAAAPGEPFARWDWDGRELTFRNDAYGMIPVFYAPLPGGVVVSPCLDMVLAAGASRALDEAAVAVFLRLGWFLDNDTPYAAVKVMPPGAKFHWRDGALTVSGGPLRAPWLDVTQDQAIELLHAHFVTAIARRRDVGAGRLVLPLSGGKDSRLILFELLRQGVRPDLCVSMCHEPPRANEDSAVASALAAALGLPWRQVPLHGSPLKREREKNRRTHFLADEHGWYMPMADYLQGRADMVFDGIGMDVFLDCILWTDARNQWARAGDARAIAHDLLKSKEPWAKCLLRTEVYGRFCFDSALERLTQTIANHLDRPNPIADFQFWSRTRREVALMNLALVGDHVGIRMPFLDAQMFEVGSGLPVEILKDGCIRTRWLARHYGEFPQMDYAGGDKAWKAFSAAFNRRYALELLTASLTAAGPINRRWLMSRAVKALVTGRQRDLDWCRPAQTVWLMDVVNAA